ncbi:hypothetical protein SB3_06720 [Methylobacterium radiotolerans]|nr:hypothetical protein SB3_06720 [Methylobacterium radiotolerans]
MPLPQFRGLPRVAVGIDDDVGVEALLAEGLSDREIARRAGVSLSTVPTVRKGREAAKIGA